MATQPGLRERKKAQTRRAIERATLELALEQGFAATTIDQIAERADVAPRTVFTRYATKTEIVFGAEDAGTTFRAALATDDGDIVDRVVAMIRRADAEARQDDEDSALESLRFRAILGDPTLRGEFRGRLDDAELLIADRLAAELHLDPLHPGIRVFAAATIGFFLTLIDMGVHGPRDRPLLEDARPGITVLRAALAAIGTEAATEAPGAG